MTHDPSDPSEPAFTQPLSTEGEAALAAVRKKRGYTLPYHRLFAAHAPQLLNRYDAFYQELTLVPRVLTPFERETVWACLLAAAREAHGFIHMERARAAGLSDDNLAACVAMAAQCEGFAVNSFAAKHWAAWTTADTLLARYLRVFMVAADGLPDGLAHLAGTTAMAARRNDAGLVFHLRHCLDAGIETVQVVEALSYVLIPCGGNVLIDAVAAWEAAAAEGIVVAPY
ncbi:MAG: carboxymuconolactone decarboxylase family protein [Burkholderiaceae bacterium]